MQGQSILIQIIKRIWIAEERGCSHKSSSALSVIFYTAQNTPVVAIVISFWQSTYKIIWLMTEKNKWCPSYWWRSFRVIKHKHNIIKKPALHLKLAWNSSKIIKLRWRLGLLEIRDLWTNNHSRLLMRHKQWSKVLYIFHIVRWAIHAWVAYLILANPIQSGTKEPWCGGNSPFLTILKIYVTFLY